MYQSEMQNVLIRLIRHGLAACEAGGCGLDGVMNGKSPDGQHGDIVFLAKRSGSVSDGRCVREGFDLVEKQLLVLTANRQQMLIGAEACGGAHYLARALREQGHDVMAHARTIREALRQDEVINEELVEVAA
jgi:hypothetical protein